MKIACPDTLPSGPGVYFFKDKNNTILYIGKAAVIKTRVQSYFAKHARDWKISALLKEHTTIEYVLTATETEACLLEAQLIQAHKPKYNVLLTSGQPFLYLLMTDEELPRVKLVRTKLAKGTYLGPFLDKGAARGALRYLVETFRLVLCNKTIENGCLDFHLGLCAGSCKKYFKPDEYRFRAGLALDALQGNQKEFIRKIEQQIDVYSTNLEFEKARHMRTYRVDLETIFATLKAKCAAHEHAVISAVLPRNYRENTLSDAGVKLQELLQLDRPVTSIDCFDISHFQSTHIVGSCIRFVYRIPDKKSFRRFKIRTITQQNDYAALREIVMRRYKNGVDLPDLILIDGGKGQLNAVTSVISTVACASIAKREERLFSSCLPDGIILDPHTDEGKLLISLRDYTHHFAVSYHRLRRSAAMRRRHDT